MNEKARYWIDIAEYDLETSKAMLETARYLYVGFTCQQAAEKGLKAIIAENGGFPPKIHNLLRLVELSGLTLTESQTALLGTLQPLSIEARYPAYKDQLTAELTADVCRDIIKETEDFLSWIKTLL